jgi:hypothetical protein
MDSSSRRRRERRKARSLARSWRTFTSISAVSCIFHQASKLRMTYTQQRLVIARLHIDLWLRLYAVVHDERQRVTVTEGRNSPVRAIREQRIPRPFQHYRQVGIAPPNRGCLKRHPLLGTLVPVEEPSTASEAGSCTAANHDARELLILLLHRRWKAASAAVHRRPNGKLCNPGSRMSRAFQARAGSVEPIAATDVLSANEQRHRPGAASAEVRR